MTVAHATKAMSAGVRASIREKMRAHLLKGEKPEDFANIGVSANFPDFIGDWRHDTYREVGMAQFEEDRASFQLWYTKKEDGTPEPPVIGSIQYGKFEGHPVAFLHDENKSEYWAIILYIDGDKLTTDWQTIEKGPFLYTKLDEKEDVIDLSSLPSDNEDDESTKDQARNGHNYILKEMPRDHPQHRGKRTCNGRDRKRDQSRSQDVRRQDVRSRDVRRRDVLRRLIEQ